MDGAVIESDVPARMDRLPWSRWHLRIVVALGTSWVLDGLEVTLVGSLSGVLQGKNGLSLSDQQVTGAATVYLAGAVIGALLFGRLTDRHGRRRLFLVTLATYSIATLGTAFSVSYLTFALARFFTGLGIGGEYAAINSAVDELIPGKIRGRVDLFINGTFWVGASLGAVATLLLLGPHSAATRKHVRGSLVVVLTLSPDHRGVPGHRNGDTKLIARYTVGSRQLLLLAPDPAAGHKHVCCALVPTLVRSRP